MKVHIKKLTSIILAVALVASMMVVPAGAALSNPGFVYDPQPSGFNIFSNALYDVIENTYGPVASFFDVVDTIALPHVGPTSMDGLLATKEYYNHNFVGILARLVGPNMEDSWFSRAEITYDIENGIYRLFDVWAEEWITDAAGEFPYAEVAGDAPDEIGANTAAPPSISRNKFIDVKNLDFKNIQLVVMTEDALAESVQLINDDGLTCTMAKTSINGADYWVIMRSGGTSAAYYCNSAGQPYVALAEASATNNQFDYIVGDNAVINDSLVIDNENGTLNLIDESGNKISLNIDDLTFDTGDKSYTVNAFTVNNEGDNYYYTYYTYEVTYNITNTYITYIGSNDAYDREEYEYYYQLPDGRSSADLTADEVAGMSFEFHDVVNYAKSATDVSVRALYHFDGNTEDSSYFSTQGSFDWVEGASITYMEAPAAFDGALYLDNTAHRFDITLPSSVGTSDCSIQFRYYQVSEPDTQDNRDNLLSVGNNRLLAWDEQNFSVGPDGEYGSWPIPTGTWNEIAVVRERHYLSIYLNGVCVYLENDYVGLWGNSITFEFGDSSRAYSMIDELRVVNFPIATGTEDYTPTVVPYDSNLVLVLPDSDRPMADEYSVIVSSYNNLLGDSHNYLDGGSTENLSVVPYDGSYPWVGALNGAFPKINYRANGAYTVSAEQDFLLLSRVGDDKAVQQGFSDSIPYFHWGFGIRLDDTSVFKANTDYTISIVHLDGSVDSWTFNTGSAFPYRSGGSNQGKVFSSSGVFSWGQFHYCSLNHSRDKNGYHTAISTVCITPSKGMSVDVVYIELVEGSSTDVHLEKRTAVYPGDFIQPNTAAVQSAIPVNGYTVGGVRPTLPSKGDVWFPVSESRIQTCYIYTGSMWEEVGCRWYTGSRWIPIYAFDINTLQDLFDVADASTAVPPLTTESAFWRWWQLQWLDFRAWLENTLSNVGGGVTNNTTIIVPSDPDNTMLPGVSDSTNDDGTVNDDGWSFLDLLVAVKDGAWRITKGIVVTGAGGIVGVVGLVTDVGNFFNAYDDNNSEGVWGVVNYGGTDIWD